MASVVLGVAGAAAGTMIPGIGPAMGYMVGSAIGQALFDTEKEKPKVGDLQVQDSSYGVPIPILYGTYRCAGNIIWADKLVRHENETDSGSGGGGITEYTYTASFAVGICEGPIFGILRIWADGKVIYDKRKRKPKIDKATGKIIRERDVRFIATSHKIYTGTEGQGPDPVMEAKVGLGNCPAYRGMAYIVFEDLLLGRYGNRIPSLSFEVVTTGTDDIPAVTQFGEYYTNMHQHDDPFRISQDPETGYLWTISNTGHAVWDEELEKWVISEDHMGQRNQVQVYDPVSKEIITVIDVDDENVHGGILVSNGFAYIGRGLPGSVVPAPICCGTGADHVCCANPGPYSHGIAINTKTGRIDSRLYDTCSSGQFNNAFYWPTIPIAPPNSPAMAMGGGNGISGGYGTAFYTFPGHPEAYQLSSCRCSPYPLRLTNYHVSLPDWAFRSQNIVGANCTIVQGWSSPYSYIGWVTCNTDEGGSSVDNPPVRWAVAKGYLPSGPVQLPPWTWDENTQTIWSFASNGGTDSGTFHTLYRVKHTGGPDLQITYADFFIPPQSGDSPTNTVMGMTYDTETGLIRVLMWDGFNGSIAFNNWFVMLIDPVLGRIVESYQIPNMPVGIGVGQMWDFPEENKLIIADGFKMLDIPYASKMAENPVPLYSIVNDISKRCNMSSATYETSTLTEMVRGFAVTDKMPGRNALEPLMYAYMFDSVESDRQVKFVHRGGPSKAMVHVDETLIDRE